jgi:glycosyltransferase involved in cell wall biosynthesis
MDKRRWKTPLKRWIWPRLFRLADMVLVPSSGSASLMRSLGIPAERIALTPYTVDNDWWLYQANCTDRVITRADWGISPDAFVVLFCAKLQPWKRPQDLLKAFAKANCPGAFLVFAGDGPLRSELVALADALAITDHVRFLGFINQSKLPGVYRAADLFVLPSEYEAFGVVVNEAMLCGCPAVVSDHVGARFDLIQPDETGFVFPVGNIERLTEILRQAHEDRPKLRRIGEAARNRMIAWSLRENIESTLEAIDRASRKRASRPGFQE